MQGGDLLLLVTACALLATPVGAGVAFSPPATADDATYEAVVCSDYGVDEVSTCVDPGILLGVHNPHVLLPGAASIRVQATITNGVGEGVRGVTVTADVTTADGTTTVDLKEMSAGVHQSAALPHDGGAVSVTTYFDVNGDGSSDHVEHVEYAPAVSLA